MLLDILKMNFKTLGFIAALGTWYYLTDKPVPKEVGKYQLPAEIKVINTTFKYETREKKRIIIEESFKKEEKWVEKYIKTDVIDFSKKFVIETERYNIIKDEDFLPAQMIGNVMSLPSCFYFYDLNVSRGLDLDKTKAVIAMLENNKKIKNLTVRINHNAAITDAYRMFFDDKVVKRNDLVARLFIGLPNSLGEEIWASCFRGDYYNPMTQTVVLYSNIESFAAHEIGHHKDFQRFETDWLYAASSAVFPPAILYKEWQASQYGKDMLSEYDKYQFNRYLLPAFLTYLLGGWYLSRNVLQKRELKAQNEERKLEEIAEHEKPQVSTAQTARLFSTWNVMLYGGIYGYQLAQVKSYPEIGAYASFIGGFILAEILVNSALKPLIPYNYELKKDNVEEMDNKGN